MEEGAVETAYDVEVYRCGVLGVEGHLHPVEVLDIYVYASSEVVELLGGAVEDGGLAYAIHSAQDVHVAAQVPDDMLATP